MTLEYYPFKLLFEKKNISLLQKHTEILDISNVAKNVFLALHSERKVND